MPSQWCQPASHIPESEAGADLRTQLSIGAANPARLLSLGRARSDRRTAPRRPRCAPMHLHGGTGRPGAQGDQEHGCRREGRYWADSPYGSYRQAPSGGA